jgi:hypothetical protein
MQHVVMVCVHEVGMRSHVRFSATAPWRETKSDYHSIIQSQIVLNLNLVIMMVPRAYYTVWGCRHQATTNKNGCFTTSL